MEIWKTLRVSHISTPPTTTTDNCQKWRYTNIPVGTKNRSGHYRCLLSYSNQPDHPKLDRFLIRDYLLALTRSTTARIAKGRSYEEQYKWLMEKRDPKSSLEAEFLRGLYECKRRLPDRAQYRPEEGVYCEADFYYERDGLKGVAVFIDGPTHDDPAQRKKDAEQRARLDDLGYRVLAIRYDRSIIDQIAENSDVFGPGVSVATAQSSK